MIKSILKPQGLMLFAVVALLFTACKKDEVLPEVGISTTQNFIGKVVSTGEKNNVDSTDMDVLCFNFVYPITIVYPDGSTASVNDANSLFESIDTWYDNNPDSEYDPTLQYPVTVILEDGTTSPIANDDELVDLYDECYEEWEDEEEWEDDEWDEWDDDCPDHYEDECFEVQFPIQIDIDGNIYTVDSWDHADSLVHTVIDSTDQNVEFDIELIFPITVVLLDSAGTTVVVNTEDELEELEDECEDEEYWEDELCFEIQFPLTLIFPDGSKAVVNDLDALDDAIDAWEDNNPDNEADVLPEFPITVAVDGMSQVIDTAEELDELIDSCE